jgi:hypothetical protein
MSNKYLRCLWAITVTALFAIYLFLFYQLCVVPAILDWSSLGVILTLVLAGLLILSLPKEKRLPITVLGITFLLLMKAFYNISNYPTWKLILSDIIIFVVLLVVGKLLGRMSFRRYLVVFIMALILNATVDISQAPFWTEFMVKWQSPQLYPQYATVDYFPVKLIDVDGDRVKEIVTQENLDRASVEKQEAAKKGKNFRILDRENNHFAVYKWNGQTFQELTTDKYDLQKLQAALPLEYLGYPFYQTTVTVSKTKGIEQQMTPFLDKAQVIEESMNFGKFPFKILTLDENSLAAAINNRNLLGQPVGSIGMAGGQLVPDPAPEKITIDNTLRVIQTPDQKVIAQLDRSQVPDIGTSEVITGDVNNDKIDELILTAETSQILQLNPNNGWKVLWSNPEPINDTDRFNKLRFDDFAPLGSDKTPQLIALSKSNVRDNPTRYMTGYEYKNGELQQRWRVFSGLINLRAGDVDGDGQNELLGYMYRSQRIYVLEKHHFPVVGILYGITGVLILLGFGLQWRQNITTIGGGERNA